MQAFADTAFDTNAFSINAFAFGTQPTEWNPPVHATLTFEALDFTASLSVVHTPFAVASFTLEPH